MIKYHEFISVVVIELSVRCFNTRPEDRQRVYQSCPHKMLMNLIRKCHNHNPLPPVVSCGVLE